MPSLWLLEMRRVVQRRQTLNPDENRNDTTSFERFLLKMGNDELHPYQSLPHNFLLEKVRCQEMNFHRLIYSILASH